MKTTTRHPHPALPGRLRQFLAMACLSTLSQAATIPDVPLHTMTTADPNIMMVLDDSGSMHFEIMPDDYTLAKHIWEWRFVDGEWKNVWVGMYSSRYVYPRANGVYGAGDYENVVATVDWDNTYARLARSPQINTVYYNPGVTYTPWIAKDGNKMGNAKITCALHNPMRDGTSADYCRDLTSDNTQYNGTIWLKCTAKDNCEIDSSDRTFWPAIYFWHNGENEWTLENYTKVEIRSSTASYSGHGRDQRTDCTGGVCTYDQEIQNFANWYTYYRSRVLTARAGIGRAFSAQGTRIRVGFGAINKATEIIDGGTSIRTLIRGVRLFKNTDREDFFDLLYKHAIPAAATPLRRSLDDVGRYYSRTDDKGPWSSAPGVGGTGASYAACRQSYTILMTDGYWNGGAGSGDSALDNDSTDGTTITGPNDKSYTYKAAFPFKDGRANTLADVAMYYWKRDLVDDKIAENKVPTSLRDPAFWQHMVTFGVGLGVSGSVSATKAFEAVDGATVEEKDQFSWPDPIPDANSSAKLDDLLHASVNSRGDFFSAKNPTEFADSLKKVLDNIAKRISSAASVVANSTRLTTQSKVFSATFNTDNWSGELESYSITSDGLSSTANWQASKKLPVHTARKIYTRVSGAGASFIDTNATSIGLSGDEINYLRGDQSKEQKNSGTLRNRSSLLGDLVHSSPNYDPVTDTVYVSANDGMLHAFNGTSGVETFAYIPGSILANLKSLTLPSYEHKFFVDGDITVAGKSTTFLDETYLVATFGRGAKGLFGLDITDPATFGTGDVLWEYTSDADVGYMLGKPMVARLDDGSTDGLLAAIVGNGYNSTNGKAVLMIFNLQTGALIKKIDTGVGSDNGLATPGLWDDDGDGFVDYVYAGDLKGNVWKFDLTGGKTSGWGSALKSGSTPKPLFVAKSGSVLQPITAPITLYRNYVTDDPNFKKVFLFFGTGSFFRSDDLTDTGTQTWYGLITDPSSSSESIASDRSTLKQRTITLETTADGKAIRTFSTSTTGDMTGKLGWYLDLLPTSGTQKGERIVTGSTMYRFTEPTLIASSIIPVANDPCALGSGYLNALNAFTGASLKEAFFILDGYTGVAGSLDLGIGLVSQAGVLAASDGKGQIIASGSGSESGKTIESGEISTGIPPQGRLSWREIIRN
jgi:type IV pilus assembly protein PilY1